MPHPWVVQDVDDIQSAMDSLNEGYFDRPKYPYIVFEIIEAVTMNSDVC